jgi:alpha-1,2-mannosyltransferase
VRTAAGWLTLAGSVAAYLLMSEFTRQPFHVGLRELRFFDLRVYRGAARRMLSDGGRIYGHPIVRRLGFTYPPAAALLLAPLALAPLHVDRLVVTGLNVAALVWILNSTLVFARVDRPASVRWSLAALLTAPILWLEPVTTAIGYGQVDLLIVGLVMFDLSRRHEHRFTGIATGVAAGLKLTPLLFIVYLFLIGRRRAAATAAAAFLTTVVVSFAVAGRSAAHYWGNLVFDTSRVGKAGDPANQSLRGALARLTDTNHPGWPIELVILVVALAGLSLAVAAARRGQPRLGYGLAAITTLLASPVSWTHHWCLAIPALVLLGIAAIRQRSPVLSVMAIAIAAIGYGYIPERFMGRRHYLITGAHSIPVDVYVLLGLAILAGAAIYSHRLKRHSVEPSEPGLTTGQATAGPDGSGVPGTAVTTGGGSS